MFDAKRIGEEVSKMVDPEAKRGKMLPIDAETATRRIEIGRAFYQENGGKAVSFGTFDEMDECVEVRSIITDETLRGQGLATKVTQKVVLGAQRLTPKPLVALCNNESSGLFRKLGFRLAAKELGFPELWQECQGCSEYGNWPNCHCQYMQLLGKMYEKRGNVFSVIELSKENDKDVMGTASLYCEVWREPPWLETDWKPNEVEKDFKKNLSKENGIALIAIYDGNIVGFTSGWNIGPKEITKRADGMLSIDDFDGQSVFYVAELAIGWQYRQAGIGKQLSLDLIAKAKKGGANRFLLRTNLNATAARTLYSNLGFVETKASDVRFADRTYWVL